MKRINSYWTIILLMIAGCGGGKQSKETIVTVDVTANYPKKELILQDFMKVEYIPLETSRDFLCQGIVKAISKDVIIVMNRVRDGDIFIFDRNGKGLRKINRMGKGGEEYTDVSDIILDENNNEMFITDFSAKKIMVYDLYGKFIRSFQQYREDVNYRSINNFDSESLICFVDYYSDSKKDVPSFIIISKQDGSIIKDIQISFEQKKSTSIIQIEDRSIHVMVILHFPLKSYNDSWILAEPSSDTLFRYLPDHSMIPFMVRKPPIQSMNPEVFLSPGMLTERYYFMKTEKKEFDFATGKGLPKKYLMYDRQEKTIYEYTVYNDDYSDKITVDVFQSTVNNEIAFCQKLEADELVEAYEKGQLKGKLKEIAENLKEEDNPVIMLVKHKK